MSLEPLNLDDLQFQRDFVDKARLRIYQLCPEWTDYNVSDPGIMLIEFFAWMAEQMLYRLNQVPDENLMMFLSLLGGQPKPIESASTALTFYLSTPFPIGTTESKDEPVAFVPQGTEVTTRPTEQERALSFTTNHPLTIRRPLLKHLLREDEVGKDYLSYLQLGGELMAFKPQPKVGDCFYLGFDGQHPIKGYLLRLEFECAATKKGEMTPQDPPLLWECSIGDGKWQEVDVSQDSTGGLTYERGSLVLHLPPLMAAQKVHSREAYWLRCSYKQAHAGQGWYMQSPRLRQAKAFTLGATIDASHAMIVKNEMLPVSSGRANQRLRLQQAPVLDFQAQFNETIEVQERYNGKLEFVPWTKVDNFASSTRHDRHFMLDRAKGEIRFGPAIRQPNGEIKQYGRVPEPQRSIRLPQYRYGGGYQGNVRANKLEILKTTLDYIDHVTNWKAARGGRDEENLEEAKMRARRQMQAQERAVTASDYETLGLKGEEGIGRIKCLTGENVLPSEGSLSFASETIELLVVPDVVDAILAGDLSKLSIEAHLKQKIKKKLDPYRLLTTTLLVREPRYYGVQVEAEVIAEGWVLWPGELKEKGRQTLNRFLSPLPLPISDLQSRSASESARDEKGWPFGQPLYLADLYALLQKIAGVKHVRNIRLKWREVDPLREQVGHASDEELIPLPDTERLLRVKPDMLICSLEHKIDIVEF
jgi:predicted phage baseplate assembly protein